MKLARAKAPTPVLKTPRFSFIFGGGNGRTLPVDNQGLLREVELVALKGTIIKMVEKCEGFVWRVEISNYPADALYADQRFLEELEAVALEKKPVLPSLETVMERMVSSLGFPTSGAAIGAPASPLFSPFIRRATRSPKICARSGP